MNEDTVMIPDAEVVAQAETAKAAVKTAATQLKSKKPTKAPLTLALLLDNACSNPDNFKQWTEWTQGHQERINSTDAAIHDAAMEEHYTGWNRYEIMLHCVKVTIIAKKHSNGGYHIRDYVLMDH